jgi:type I restriction enzyme S subunit
MMKLGEVAEIVNGGTPKTEKTEYWKEEVLWVTPAEMNDSKGIYLSDSKRKISKLGLENSSAHIVPENSVILSTRAPIGYLKINAVPMAFNQGCRGIICNTEKILPEFLYFYLLTQREELNLLGTGATFKELSATNLKTFQIPVPPLSVQEQIVAKYTEIEQIKKGNMRLVEILEGERAEELKGLFH